MREDQGARLAAVCPVHEVRDHLPSQPQCLPQNSHIPRFETVDKSLYSEEGQGRLQKFRFPASVHIRVGTERISIGQGRNVERCLHLVQFLEIF